MKKLRLVLLWLFWCALWSLSPVVGQNNCLDFDGNGDHIDLTPIPISANSNFTVEMWFHSTATSTSTNCSGNFKRLFSLGGPNSRFEVGECGGNLSVYWYDGTSQGPFQTTAANIRDGLWHCISVTRNGQNMDIWLDCDLVYSTSQIGTLNSTRFRIGQWAGGLTGNDEWQGQIDEVKLWDFARSAGDICADKNCLSFGDEPGLVVYWPLDEGIANGNNTSKTFVTDLAAPVNNGTLSGFVRTGTTSNFVPSGAGLVYPNYQNLDLQISDYFSPGTLITQICTGEPLHFCLTTNGQPVLLPNVIDPTTNVTATVAWQFLDNSVTNWTTILSAPFSDFCFPVGPSVVTAVCSPNADGFVDRQYRAVVTVIDPTLGTSCDYVSEVQNLRICCPISPSATVAVTTNLPDDLLCAGDMVDFTIELHSPDQFVNTPGPAVTIDWKYNGIPIPAAANQTTFVYPVAAVSEPAACFEATVKNCAGKLMTYKSCITVDPVPMCGSITELPTGTLTPDPIVPDKYYICPGNDAALQKVDAAAFNSGGVSWQFMFPSVGDWIDLGTSNDIQNTNILPCTKPSSSPYLWPAGETCIKYRIVVKPYSDPSGCEPCYSNELTICLSTAPIADVIVGDTEVCAGETALLTVGNFNADYTYTWFWNGLQVGTGEFYTASKTGCYLVEISNGCQSTATAKHCLTICETVAVISCPLAPNDCACEGQSIQLTGCSPNYSRDNCVGALLYDWTWDSGTVLAVNGCDLEHLPAPSGTTYTLTVTNTLTGCSATTSTFIKPCAKP